MIVYDLSYRCGVTNQAEEKLLAGEGIELVKVPRPAKPKGN